jgi:hypothetical protein
MPSDKRTFLSVFSCRRRRYFRFHVQGVVRALCIFLLSGVLSSCDSAPSGQSRAPVAGAAPSVPEGAIAPLLPPSVNDRPPEPGTGTGLSALPGMQPPKGLNVEALFAEDIRDPIDRIKRVENVVLDLRRDFNTVLPSIMRLVAVEQDIQNLIGQLQTLTEAGPADAATSVPTAFAEPSGNEKGADPIGATQHLPTAQSGRAEDSQAPPASGSDPPQSPPDEPSVVLDGPVPPAAAPPAQAPPVSGSVSASGASSLVRALRIAAHPDKTRLILSVDGPAAEVWATLTDEGKRLVVDLPGVRWEAGAQDTPPDGPLVAEWRVEPMASEGGTTLIVLLKAPATLTGPLTIPAVSGDGARIAIDLKPAP